MGVDFETFLAWAQTRFPSVKVTAKEVLVGSIFAEDSKHHLSCNPAKNCYHCLKSDEGGTLQKLVSLVDKCSIGEAKERLGLSGGGNVRDLESRLEMLYADGKPAARPVVENRVKLPENTFLLSALAADSHYRKRAEEYIRGRRLPLGDLHVCVGGKYKDRIIIPYYGPNRELIYWNGRDLTGRAPLRYRGPDKEEVGYGKEDVLWFEEWPRPGTRVYLTEGEFDAMSLNLTGLVAAACGGKNLGPKQMEMLRPYQLTIAFDADKSGAGALNKIGEMLEQEGIGGGQFVRPPALYKDWNEMLKADGPKMMRLYVQQNEKPIDTWATNSLRLFTR